MKAITILQPFASLIVTGVKNYETRSWDTNYRGKIAIHAGKNDFVLQKENRADKEVMTRSLEILGVEDWGRLPHGAIIAVAELVECYRALPTQPNKKRWLESRVILDKNGEMKRDADGRKIGWHEKPFPEGDEFLFGNYELGQWAWELKNVVPLLTPIPYRGNQRLWDVPDELLAPALKGAFTL